MHSLANQKALYQTLSFMNQQKSFSKIVLDAVAAIKQKIDSNPLQRKNISELTSKIYIGKNILHEAFKAVEGKTIARYQLEKRMEKACEMLETCTYTIQQIAAKCGYTDQANFTNDFKRVFHISPKEWIKRNCH